MNRALIMLLVMAPGLAIANTGEEWRFRVLLDGQDVGTHTYRLEYRDGERRVQSNAQFNVKFLFIDAYTYAHTALERWTGNCLNTIESRTDDNGDRFSVQGVRRGSRFDLAATGIRSELPGCVMSFAYWNPAMLRQGQLLNAQTGELLDVRVEPLGEETLSVRSAPVAARRYALHTPKFRIDVWYVADRQWVQLESTTESGRKLRYLIQ
jgi:hypothetical protein